MHSVFVLLLLVPTSTALRLPLLNPKKSISFQEKQGLVQQEPNDVDTKKRKTAHIYVINLNKRPDRCKCMEKQLAGSPYQVFRQEAATPGNFHSRCPGVIGQHSESHTSSAKAIFCSNQLVYASINGTEDKADFYIIMEDDLQVKNSLEFWDQLQSFLNSDCTNDPWDILTVDTWALHKKNNFEKAGTMTAKCPSDHAGSSSFQVYKTNSTRYGAHMTIIKSETIPKLLHRKLHIEDHYKQFEKDGIDVRYWQPELVSQASRWSKFDSDTINSVAKSNALQFHCSKSVKQSDNKVFSEGDNEGKQRVSLNCPSDVDMGPQ